MLLLLDEEYILPVCSCMILKEHLKASGLGWLLLSSQVTGTRKSKIGQLGEALVEREEAASKF